MCGRITHTSPREAIANEFGVARFAEVDWHPRYNVAPSQIVDTIISVNGEKRLGPMRWGFVSATVEEPKLAPGTGTLQRGGTLGRSAFRATDMPPSRFEAVKGR
jgi:putative SOS response-associated peptidase YedK